MSDAAFPAITRMLWADGTIERSSGLTKRELLSAIALHGLLAGNHWEYDNWEQYIDTSIHIADKLMENLQLEADE